MRKSIAVLLSLAVLSGSALADTQAATIKAKKCLFPDGGGRAPAWVCTTRADGWKLTTVGSVAHSAAGNSFMEQMAAADARSRLVRDVRRAVRNKLKIADKDEVITTDTLQGVKVLKNAYDSKGTLYVLIGMDAANAKKLTDDITAEYLAQQRQ